MFFRAETQQKALELGIRGWVRNNPDGTVEAVAEGQSLDNFIAWCKKGPSRAKVEKIDIDDEPNDPSFTTFSIVR